MKKFSLQLKQVYKKIYSKVYKINADIDQPRLFYDSLISCNKVVLHLGMMFESVKFYE